MKKTSSIPEYRTSVWDGFSSFPRTLIELAQLRRNLLNYAVGTLLAAISISLVIAVLGYIPYRLLSSLNSESISLGYLLQLWPNIMATIICLVLLTGWWQVYLYESSVNQQLDTLLDKDASDLKRLEALDRLKARGELAKGRLQNKTIYKLNAPHYDWNGANLQGVAFLHGDLSGCDFSGASIQRATFGGVDLKDANFCNADMTDVDMENAENAERIKFNLATILPVDSSNRKDRPLDVKKFDEIKNRALKEASENPSSHVWRRRLWYRYTKETRRVEIPSLGDSDDEKQILALRTKFETLIEEFNSTASTPNSHIYATAYVYKSIWFPALSPSPYVNILNELRDKYWKAHLDALRRGISITRIFVVEAPEDLHRRVDHGSESGTVIELIKRQDDEENMETGICKLDAFNSSAAASINSGTEDFIIFADEDNLRCYLLSGIGATSAGSILYSEVPIRERLGAFQWLLKNCNYMEDIR
jgi:hypothetical protein